MFYKLGTTANRKVQAAEHAFALRRHIRLLAFSCLDVDTERFTFKEDLEVAIMLQYQMSSNLVEHTLERGSPRLNKVTFKSAHRLLIWRRGHDDARVVLVQLLI